ERDNWIGSGPQGNGWHTTWGRFFCERRIAPQAELLAARGVALPGLEALLARLPAWLDQHPSDPCLVHGDLWSGNAMAAISGLSDQALGAAIFDPAVHRADREVDLAMARLFGGFADDFFAAYEEEWPLPEGAEQRVAVYNLYHLLNHANLFAGGYIVQARHLLRSCLDSLGA
ncbi:MAG: fructosamine kinase family protein, partial [Cyanobium sp.]